MKTEDRFSSSFPRSAWERTASRRSGVADLAPRKNVRHAQTRFASWPGSTQQQGTEAATQERREAGRSHAERGNEELLSRFSTLCLMILCSMILCSSAHADTVKHQVTGLCMKEREQDLREAVEKMPQVKLVSIDFKNAEATFEYDPKKAFPGVKPEQVMQQFDNLLKSASNRTFGIKPLRSVPLEKLTLIEIPVAGLDCKGCSLAAYEAIYKLDGVERATASFREGLVTALIDPAKTDRAKLEDALKKRGVQVKAP